MEKATKYLVIGLFTIITLVLLYACSTLPESEFEQGTSTLMIQIEPFIQLAQDAACADDRNQLYVIDDQYVFWASEGPCSDASYAYILYGQTPQEKLCYLEDSIVGPRSACEPALNEMFETILDNLDQPDLGLGDGHDITKVPY